MANLEAQVREGFIEIVNDVVKHPDIFIINVNDEYMFMKFIYKGILYYVETAPYYPLDINHLGIYNYMAYRITDMNMKRQITYYKEWQGIDNLKESEHKLRFITGTQNQYIDVYMNNYMKTVSFIVGRTGTSKQIESLRRAVLLKTAVWTEDKKVVQIVDSRDNTSFCVDIVHKEIV